MRTAIYARKSNDDNDKNVADKSVKRQVDHAKAFIRKKGWRAPDDEHIYIDDGISGADFKRPGMLRMLNHLSDFDVIIMSEQSRIGREMTQTAGVIAKIVSRGVKVWFYLNESELRYENAIDKVVVQLFGFSNEVERELASQRSRDAALKRATEGRNFGGRCFGYDNIWRLTDGREQLSVPGEPKPVGAQTLYRINQEEAEIVRAIFRQYADGYGGRTIACTINGDPRHEALRQRYYGGQCPPPPRNNSKTWSATTIRDILRNPRYLGFIPYGATRRRLALGDGPKTTKAKEQLFPAPELRIVDERLADAVKNRCQNMRSVYLNRTGGQLHGRPDSGRVSRYLLSGLVRCEGCGASMVVSSYGLGSGDGRRQVRCYVCSFRQNRGPTACENQHRPRLDELDAQVLTAIEKQALCPEFLLKSISVAAERVRAKTASQPDTGAKLKRELAQAERERGRLVTAIRMGGKALESLVPELTRCEQRIEALKRDLAHLSAPQTLDELGDRRIEQKLREYAFNWRKTLAGEPEQARQALRKLMAGPIWYVPQKRGYRLRGATRLGALLLSAPEDETRIMLASPRGFEPRLPP